MLLLVALLAVALTACDTPSFVTEASPSADATTSVPLTRVTAGSPAPLEAAAVVVAFDAAVAGELIEPVPPDVDFATDALLCVYLGERSTGGWALALGSATLRGDELRILARETRPRGNVTQALTYPGDCATVPLEALPAGSLTVRAHDTVSDELIVEGTIEVPAREGPG